MTRLDHLAVVRGRDAGSVVVGKASSSVTGRQLFHNCSCRVKRERQREMMEGGERDREIEKGGSWEKERWRRRERTTYRNKTTEL